MRRIGAIHGLRGIAILGVVFHHSFWRYSFESGIGRPILTNGWMGVDLFFVLSGFVLYLPFAAGKPFSGREFYRRRFFRLAPLFFVVALVSTAFAGFAGVMDRAFYTSTIALFSGLFTLRPQTFFPAANWVLWSLGVELLFSVFFPILVVGRRRLVWITIAAMIVCTALRAFGYWHGTRQYLDWISASAFARLDEFLLGMVAAYLYRAKHRLLEIRFLTLAGTVLILLSCAGFDLWISKRLPSYAAGGLITLLDLGIFAVLLGVLGHPDGIVARVLEWRPLQVVGMMCYSIYVWHGIVLLHLYKITTTDAVPPFGLHYFAYLAILFAMSAMTYRYVEFRGVDDWRSLFLLLPARSEPVAAKEPAAVRTG